jgi:hypothetical protein
MPSVLEVLNLEVAVVVVRLDCVWDDEFVVDGVQCLCRCTSLDIVNYVFLSSLISVVQWSSMPGLAYVRFQTKGYSTTV